MIYDVHVQWEDGLEYDGVVNAKDEIEAFLIAQFEWERWGPTIESMKITIIERCVDTHDS